MQIGDFSVSRIAPFLSILGRLQAANSCFKLHFEALSCKQLAPQLAYCCSWRRSLSDSKGGRKAIGRSGACICQWIDFWRRGYVGGVGSIERTRRCRIGKRRTGRWRWGCAVHISAASLRAAQDRLRKFWPMGAPCRASS
eukprot:6213922-Pleurochrysis_carterae.AAC.1